MTMSDAWPSPDAQPGPLPRIDDLPLAEQGYEQEAVRAAFDSFYRHAAQLDASLRALEAVEVFRRDADALRNDLRAIRSLGLGGFGDEPSWASRTQERARPEVPAVAFRLAAEAALIIAVAVIAGVAHLSSAAIVGLMAGAFVIVALSEWLASRARYVPPAGGFVTAEALEPAPYVEAPAPEWAPPASGEPDEEPAPEALNVIGADTDESAADEADADEADADEADADAVVDPWEQPAEDDAEEAEPHEGEPGFLRRLRR
jgi:hypothetical protein